MQIIGFNLKFWLFAQQKFTQVCAVLKDIRDVYRIIMMSLSLAFCFPYWKQ